MSEPSYLEQFRWTPETENVFLEHLGLRGSVVSACRKVGCARATAYLHRERDEGFASRWEFALKVAVARLENVAWKRAVVGEIEETETVTDGPEGREIKVSRVRKVDNRLLTFLMQAHDERYRKSAENGQPQVQVNVVNVIMDANNEARERAKTLRAGSSAPFIDHEPSGNRSGDGPSGESKVSR